MKLRAPVLDLLFVMLFVGIGRSSHRHGISLSGMASTTWPFAVGLCVGWFVIWRLRRTNVAPVSGLIIVLVTVALAMTLRVISGQGTAAAFIVVALAFLSLFLVGWRTALSAWSRSR